MEISKDMVIEALSIVNSVNEVICDDGVITLQDHDDLEFSLAFLLDQAVHYKNDSFGEPRIDLKKLVPYVKEFYEKRGEAADPVY